MVPSSVVTYPRVIESYEDPPAGLSSPYASQHIGVSLPLVPFSKTPSERDWSLYRSWVEEQEQRNIEDKDDLTLGKVEGEILTQSSLFSLSPGKWLTDAVIQASIQSILRLHPLEPSVSFLPHFFFTKLMNEGHVNRDIEGSYDYNNVRNWVKKRIEGKKVSDMSTLVMFQNQGRLHWVCYGVFLEKKIIQEFDSLGGGDVRALMNIYHWLHDSMQSEGQELISTDWCLYKSRDDNPLQGNGFDCGLFAVMLSLCIANDLPLNFVDQSIMERGRCQLWLHLMSLMKKKGEVLDLMTPPPSLTSPGPVLDLRSPTPVSRRLTYEATEDGGDEGAGNDATSRSGGEGQPVQEGNGDGGQVGESPDITRGNGGDNADPNGDDPNGDGPNGDDPNDDPQPPSPKKGRKKRKSRKKKERGEETVTEDEGEKTTPKKRKAKWDQPESPSKKSRRILHLPPDDATVAKDDATVAKLPKYKKTEVAERRSPRTKINPEADDATVAKDDATVAKIPKYKKTEVPQRRSPRTKINPEAKESTSLAAAPPLSPEAKESTSLAAAPPLSPEAKESASLADLFATEEEFLPTEVEPEKEFPPPPTNEEDKDDDPMSRIVDTVPLHAVARAATTEDDDGGSAKSLDDKSLNEEDGPAKKKAAQKKHFEELTMAHQNSPPSTRRKALLPTQKNSPGKAKGTTKPPLPPVEKILEDDSLLNITSKPGGFTSQKDVANFFQNITGVARQKMKADAERRQKKEPHSLNKSKAEIKLLAQQAKEERLQKRLQAKEMRLAEQQKRMEAQAKEENETVFAEQAALRLHKKIYKKLLHGKRQKGKTKERQHEQELLRNLNKNFEHKVDDKVEEEPYWFNESVLEISKLRYHPPVLKYPKGTRIVGARQNLYTRPTIREHFSGMVKNPTGGNEILSKEIAPSWVRFYFSAIFVELVMLSPNQWFPVPVGNSRPVDEKAPANLLVTKVPIRYQQLDRDHCLLLGVASCLDYCGETEAAVKFSHQATQCENLTRDLAIKKLKDAMLQFLPCIGDCTIFNVRNAKKRTIKKLSIEDLITRKTRFPTVILLLGNDGAYNHAVVVIDDIVFDSTQEFALKLCRESLDWICGDKGMASIYIGLRFNRGNATKDKLQHVDTVNW